MHNCDAVTMDDVIMTSIHDVNETVFFVTINTHLEH